MAKNYTCDRCGKPYYPAQWHPRFAVSERCYTDMEQSKFVWKYVDLCNDCYTRLAKWLDGEVDND